MKKEKSKGQKQVQGTLQGALMQTLTLTSAVAALGTSLGVNVEDVFASSLGIVDLSAVQIKLDSAGGSLQAKLGTFQYNFSADNPPSLDNFLSADAIKFDVNLLQDWIANSQIKFDLNAIKFDAALYKEFPDQNLINIGGSVLFILPKDISPQNPFLLSLSDLQIAGLAGGDLTLLTLGIQSMTFDFVPTQGLRITNVVAATVPEPASLLLLGTGFAGLAWTRWKQLKKRNDIIA